MMKKMNRRATRRSFPGNSGFTLIEVMVASVVAVIALMAIVQLTQMSFKAQKQVSLTQDFNNLMSSLMLTMNNSDACTAAMNGKNFTPTGTVNTPGPLISTSLTVGGTPLALNATIGEWQITRLDLQDTGRAPTVVNFGGGTFKYYYLAKLFITAKQLNQNTLGSNTKAPSAIPVNIVTTTPGATTISACYGESDSAAKACESVGGSWSVNKCVYSVGGNLLSASQNAAYQACTALNGTYTYVNATTPGTCFISTSSTVATTIATTATTSTAPTTSTATTTSTSTATTTSTSTSTSTSTTATTTSVSGSTTASDFRLKKDIRPFDPGLEELLAIRPVWFRYNGLGETQSDRDLHVGVIAQELEKSTPDLVRTAQVKFHPEDTELTPIKKVDYQGIVFMLVNAVQNQQKQLDRDRETIEALKKKVDSLEHSSK